MKKQIVSEIGIIPIMPKNGHVAYVSFVIFNCFRVNSVAIHLRIGGGIRLVYPRDGLFNTCYPIDHDFGDHIEQAILFEILEKKLFLIEY